ncbi:MAG TPA: ISNCY family transposase [Dehalococcoidia bacterium]|nr:ISNCY family transposase [Dehalococcoidia bacterium]
MKGLTLSAKEQNRLQILNGVLERHWTMQEAAPLLGVSERQGWRLLAAYRKEGARGLAHKNRGRVPPNATPETIQRWVVVLAQERYQGVNHTHLTELLSEREGLMLSRPTLRRILRQAGLSSPRQRRPPQHRCRRQRMPQEGMLLQLDGSPHAWLEDRGPWLTLLLAIDDATGKAPYALFQEQEDTRGYMSLLQGVIEGPGVPLAVYTDGPSVFQPRRGPWELSPLCRKGAETQWSRALAELGITQILAHSPQAKGRVERANGTFQDRLVTELRLAGAGTVEEANQVLADFLPQFNQRFGVPAVQTESAYRPIDPELDLGSMLCIKELRRVAKDNTVQYHGRTLQLFPDLERPSYAGARVEVQERLDGSLLVRHQGKFLTPVDAPPLADQLRNQVPTGPVAATLPDPDPTDWSPPPRVKVPVIPGPLAGDPIWYEDPIRKQLHRDLVLEGMERARQQGKRIGRPRVRERPGFEQRFIEVVGRIGPEGITRTQAARELGVGYATLKRLLDAQVIAVASTEFG